MFETGQRVQLPGKGLPEWVTVDLARPVGTGWQLYVQDDDGRLHKVTLSDVEAREVAVLHDDGAGDSARVLAGFWTRWMAAAAANADATMLASSPLRPYPHQSNAVYGAMLPQPRLRFLLADEPGTGKTIMAGLYLREMQKLGHVHRALVVVPAGLVSKWQVDFERFFGSELRRITNETIQQHGLAVPHDIWVVSLELAAVNPSVQEAIRVDRAGWDAVVFDEAHRLTPTAETFHRLGSLLAKQAPRALLMTATPHRGSEWLFRHLLHLVDPEVFPDPGEDRDDNLRAIKPGPIHFLRRMKEDLVDYDGRTRLFKGRRARNLAVPLNSVEDAFYREALELVDAYFPPSAAPLARMVYGKRAASTLHSLAETLRRRRDGMGSVLPVAAAQLADPNDEDVWTAHEARVVAEASRSPRAEKKAIEDVLGRLVPLLDGDLPASKWGPLVDACLSQNGIRPGNGEQAVVFTEYADSADWIVHRLNGDGFTARRFSGRDPSAVRDQVRASFMARQFQIIVSTDAGNEGIDLQAAHVLVNYDIPWSLVRLEQRMGRIHRVGQTRDIELYNLVADGTREGEVLQALLENFVAAANQLDGRMFDSLSLVAELAHLDVEGMLTNTYGGDDKRAAALAAVKAVGQTQLRSIAQQARSAEAALASTVDVSAAVHLLNADTLKRINPAIVEEYLRRLDAAKVAKVSKTAAGEGILRMSVPDDRPLPAGLGGTTQAVVATSGTALLVAQANGATMSDAVRLGPGEGAFKELLGYAIQKLDPDMFRGGLLVDPTSVDDYDLFAFDGDLAESEGRRSGRWSVVIRTDDLGTRPVRWETLANLLPADGAAGRTHAGRALDAKARAEQLAGEEEARRRQAMEAWIAGVERQLRRLPTELSRDIGDSARRVSQRRRLEGSVVGRLDELRRSADIRITSIRQVAHAKVRAAALPLDPFERDSERIAMRLVRDDLSSAGWRVADVSAEQRGYDLYAAHGRAQRCVEVKGVWGSAASTGVRLTGNEVLVATQLRTDYWLYVVDQCSAGSGSLFGVYRDPVSTFAAATTRKVFFSVPGSALKEARQEVIGA